LMVGNKKTYKNCGILIGTLSKMKVGFDGEKACIDFDGKNFDLLLNTMSVKDVEQLAGRIQRCNRPIIVDFVDKFSSFDKHWALRSTWYQSRNGALLEAKAPFVIDVEKAFEEGFGNRD